MSNSLSTATVNSAPLPLGAPGQAEEFRTRIHVILADFLDGKAAEFPSAKATGPFLTELRAFLLDGGKRLRPLLCHLGWLGADGGAHDPAVLRAAVSLELFHAAALIHDDIIDRSHTRRNHPTTHLRLAHHWPDPTRPERADWFGISAAIIAGDLCWAWSEEMFRTCGLPEATLSRAAPYLAAMRTEVMIGEYLDIHPPTADPSRWLEHARQVNLYKTARYTVARPLQIGGALAGAGPELLACYQHFGEHLGVAFQLRDDLLGIYGDPAVTGKPNTDDLREGKRTVLIALALLHATPDQAATIHTLLGDPDLTDIDLLRAAVTDTTAPILVHDAITTASQQAVQALAAAPLDDAVRIALTRIAATLTTRTA
jgi:geranylgeranyl diphosphate synthase type I